MIVALDSSRRFYCCRGATDMRNGFDALAGIIRNEFELNPCSGDVFVFFNRRKNQVKLLSWEQDGFSVYYKRLVRGTYELSSEKGSAGIIKQEVFQCILSGISIKHITLGKRHIHTGEMCKSTA